MDRCFLATVGTLLSCLAVSACHPVEGGAPSEETSEAQLAQVPINPDHDWRLYGLTFANDAPFADILVIGDDDVGGYAKTTEYWFVHTSNLQYLGTEAIDADHTDGDGTPPSLSADQEFTQPVYLTWQSFTSDPQEDVGDLYSNGRHHLRVTVDSGEVSAVTWYQIIRSQNAQNVAPDGRFLVGGDEVTVPTNYLGYYIHADID